MDFSIRLPVSLTLGDWESQDLLKHPCRQLGWRCPQLVKPTWIRTRNSGSWLLEQGGSSAFDYVSFFPQCAEAACVTP